MAEIQVAVINSSTVLSDNDVQAAIGPLQTQVSRDFAPAWQADATLTFVPQGSSPAAGSWWLVILDNSDQAGALGYHDLTTDGLPLGKVFAGSDMQYGQPWTVTASHELLEVLADPDINLTVFVQSDPQTGMIYAHEVCDACEADQFAYQIDGTAVSDFVYPSWFESFRAPGSTQFDFSQQIQGPFQLVAGGYIGVFNVTAGSGWQQLFADKSGFNVLDTQAVLRALAAPVAARYDLRPRTGSRRERRRTPRSQWLRSNPKTVKELQATMQAARQLTPKA
jgi:hypothetical protein